MADSFEEETCLDGRPAALDERQGLVAVPLGACSSPCSHAACERYQPASARSVEVAASTPAAMAVRRRRLVDGDQGCGGVETQAHAGVVAAGLDGQRQQLGGLRRLAVRAARSAWSAAASRWPAASRCRAASASSHTSARRAWIASPCVVVDEVDDGVGEQGVGQADPVGVLTHECRARLEHVRGAGGGEEVAGEWPAVQGDDGELLDRHGGQRRDP